MDRRPKFTTDTGSTAPHVGQMLRSYYKEKRIYQAALARALGRDYKTVTDYKKRPSIQTAILWELCHALKHNFFADIAAQLPTEFTSNVPEDRAAEERIAALELKVAKLEGERDLLKEVVMGRG